MRHQFDKQNPEIAAIQDERLIAERKFKSIREEHYRDIAKLGKKIEKLRSELHVKNKVHYYVYVCLVNGKPKYVGMGSGTRLHHCTTGASSCRDLNRDYHQFGKENMLTVKVRYDLSKDIAEEYESLLINDLISDDHHLYNKKFTVCKEGGYYGASYRLCSSIHNLDTPKEKPKWWDTMLFEFDPDKYNDSEDSYRECCCE